MAKQKKRAILRFILPEFFFLGAGSYQYDACALLPLSRDSPNSNRYIRVCKKPRTLLHAFGQRVSSTITLQQAPQESISYHSPSGQLKDMLNFCLFNYTTIAGDNYNLDCSRTTTNTNSCNVVTTKTVTTGNPLPLGKLFFGLAFISLLM